MGRRKNCYARPAASWCRFAVPKSAYGGQVHKNKPLNNLPPIRSKNRTDTQRAFYLHTNSILGKCMWPTSNMRTLSRSSRLHLGYIATPRPDVLTPAVIYAMKRMLNPKPATKRGTNITEASGTTVYVWYTKQECRTEWRLSSTKPDESETGWHTEH